MKSERYQKVRVTAKDLLNELEANPEYIARMELEIERRKMARKEYLLEAIPIMEELSQVGITVIEDEGISSIYRTEANRDKKVYTRAVPILINWLPRVQNRYVKDDIVRTLTVPWAKPVAALPLIAEYKEIDNDSLDGFIKWAIGNALSVVADDSVYADIVNLAQDKRHGKAREMVVVALGNMRTPDAVEVLTNLLNDDEVAGHAIIALGKLKAKEAKENIEPFLNHPKAWIRKEAKRAIAKIDKVK